MSRYLLAAAALGGLCQAQFATFLTRPGQQSVTISIRTNTNPAALDPGYIFVTPYLSDFVKTSYGPHIFDNNGTLVYDGYQTVESRAMDAHVCDYLGSIGTHLCYNDALPIQQGGHSSGPVRFFDNTYTQVGTDFGGANGLIAPDIHELNTPTGYGGNSLLQDVYTTVQQNLTAFGGQEVGFVNAGCFQDISIATKAVTFQWCSTDHIALNETNVPLKNSGNIIAGNGSQATPWDYFHFNSVDKDAHGDYLVSGRHTDALYKIAGLNSPNPGSIIWRLGGHKNSFKFLGNFNFSRQHMARFHETSGSVTNITLFDNAADGGKSKNSVTAKASSGMVVAVDTAAKTARLVEQFVQPEGQLVTSQGSLIFLPNGNRFLGWGAFPAFSEYAPSGALLYNAHFSIGQSFRVWKSPWTARPAAPPDVLAYAQSCSAPLVLYASWNGATEVRAWRFSTATSNATNATFLPVATVPKTGYETMLQLPLAKSFAPFILAEALDASGAVLRASLRVPTFVPDAALAPSCNATQCAAGTNYTLANSAAGACPVANATRAANGTYVALAARVADADENVVETAHENVFVSRVLGALDKVSRGGAESWGEVAVEAIGGLASARSLRVGREAEGPEDMVLERKGRRRRNRGRLTQRSSGLRA